MRNSLRCMGLAFALACSSVTDAEVHRRNLFANVTNSSLTIAPTSSPTLAPTDPPSLTPTDSPTLAPTGHPTLAPSSSPVLAPTLTLAPTSAPTITPTSVGGRQQALGRWSGADPLGEWTFARADCLKGVFPNTGSGEYFGGLTRNGSTSPGGANALTACVAGRGVQGLSDLPASTGVTLGSQRDVSALAALAPRGLTFEVWATFNSTSQSALALLARPLLFIGQTNNEPGSTLADACDTTPWFNFGAYSRNGALTCAAPQYATLDDTDCLSTSATALTE